MNNKIGIAIVIVMLLLGAGIFAWYQLKPQKNSIPIVRDQGQVVAAPTAILRGDIKLTYFLPIDIRPGYVAVYQIFYQGELVGEVSRSRVDPNKTEIVSVINIPEIYQERATSTLIHTLDSKAQKRSVERISGGAITGGPFQWQIDTIVDYNTNLVNTTVKMNVNILPLVSVPIAPNAVNQIDVANLYVGWEENDIKVVDKTTVTVPTGTFDVFVVEMSGTATSGDAGKVTYYITPAGKMVQAITHSPLPPELASPLVFKFKSYLPIADGREN